MKPPLLRETTQYQRQKHSPSYKFRWISATIIVSMSAVTAVLGSWFLFGVTNTVVPTALQNDVAETRLSAVGAADKLHRSTPELADQSPETSPAPKVTSTATTLTPQSVIAAFDCARRKRHLSPYIHDTALDEKAREILMRILSSPKQPLGDHEQGFTLTGQLNLEADYPVLTECMIGGFDVGRVEQLELSSRIGVSIAPIELYEEEIFLAVIVGY